MLSAVVSWFLPSTGGLRSTRWLCIRPRPSRCSSLSPKIGDDVHLEVGTQRLRLAHNINVHFSVAGRATGRSKMSSTSSLSTNTALLPTRPYNYRYGLHDRYMTPARYYHGSPRLSVYSLWTTVSRTQVTAMGHQGVIPRPRSCLQLGPMSWSRPLCSKTSRMGSSNRASLMPC